MDRNSSKLKAANIAAMGDVSPEPLCTATATAIFGTSTTAIDTRGHDTHPHVDLDCTRAGTAGASRKNSIGVM